MHSQSDLVPRESESSLPIHTEQSLPSSPPTIQPRNVAFDTLQEMESQPHFKSEPPATETEEATKPALRRVSSEETERPPSAQQAQRHESVSEEDENDEDQELDSDPAAQVVDFDWDKLYRKYQDAMGGCHVEEGQLAEDWESLMNYFRIWAESGHEHETHRTYHRLKTRATYVQNSEVSLEQKRNHYISVVKAFESALRLLRAQNVGR